MKQKASLGAATAIRSCSCTHAFQDMVYGRGMRLHNRRTKQAGWRCTVCAREVTTGAA